MLTLNILRLVKHHLEKAMKINDGNYHSHALMGELMMAYGAFNPKSYQAGN